MRWCIIIVEEKAQFRIDYLMHFQPLILEICTFSLPKCVYSGTSIDIIISSQGSWNWLWCLVFNLHCLYMKGDFLEGYSEYYLENKKEKFWNCCFHFGFLVGGAYFHHEMKVVDQPTAWHCKNLCAKSFFLTFCVIMDFKACVNFFSCYCICFAHNNLISSTCQYIVSY